MLGPIANRRILESGFRESRFAELLLGPILPFAFTLNGKGAGPMILVATVLVPLFVIATAVVCRRTRVLSWKWLVTASR